jgi:DNA-binding NarL/FixJ family response regulator
MSINSANATPHALVLTTDPFCSKTLDGILRQQLQIDATVCSEANIAIELLARTKLDGVIVDCAMPGWDSLLRCLRHATSNREAIAIAIANECGVAHEAMSLGANFVIERPLSGVMTQRVFSAAHGLMVRARQRYFRLDVDIAARLRSGPVTTHVNVFNLSETGAAVSTTSALQPGQAVKLSFTLPSSLIAIEQSGSVVWAQGHKAGIQFNLNPLTKVLIREAIHECVQADPRRKSLQVLRAS